MWVNKTSIRVPSSRYQYVTRHKLSHSPTTIVSSGISSIKHFLSVSPKWKYRQDPLDIQNNRNNMWKSIIFDTGSKYVLCFVSRSTDGDLLTPLVVAKLEKHMDASAQELPDTAGEDGPKKSYFQIKVSCFTEVWPPRILKGVTWNIVGQGFPWSKWRDALLSWNRSFLPP